MVASCHEHPVEFRQEILRPILARVAAAESCAVVAPASSGKSRLLRFLLRMDVQQHYLGRDMDSLLVVLVDGNDVAEVSPWGLYELLLTSLVDATARRGLDDVQRAELTALRREVIVTPNEHLAWRDLRRAIAVLHEETGADLCFILDEFDILYRDLPPLVLNHLRALRDAHKDHLSYIVALRDHPARLRPATECESFYELLSRSVIGIGPYSPADAACVVDQQEARKKHRLEEDTRMHILQLAGGHPGLIVALFDSAMTGSPPPGADWIGWALRQPAVVDECRKMWDGLADDEQLALSALTQGIEPDAPVLQLLVLKGMVHQLGDAGSVQPASVCLFNPLFARFVVEQDTTVERVFWLDEATREVYIGGRAVAGLTARQFDLLAFLYARRGKVCTHDEIIYHLYPSEEHADGVSNEALTSLVRYTRKRIEPAPRRPQYLLTVRGVGYKLVVPRRESDE